MLKGRPIEPSHGLHQHALSALIAAPRCYPQLSLKHRDCPYPGLIIEASCSLLTEVRPLGVEARASRFGLSPGGAIWCCETSTGNGKRHDGDIEYSTTAQQIFTLLEDIPAPRMEMLQRPLGLEFFATGNDDLPTEYGIRHL